VSELHRYLRTHPPKEGTVRASISNRPSPQKGPRWEQFLTAPGMSPGNRVGVGAGWGMCREGRHGGGSGQHVHPLERGNQKTWPGGDVASWWWGGAEAPLGTMETPTVTPGQQQRRMSQSVQAVLAMGLPGAAYCHSRATVASTPTRTLPHSRGSKRPS
jgi:hypothetical protein